MTRKLDVVFDRGESEVVLVVYEDNQILETYTGRDAVELFEDLIGGRVDE